MVMAGAVCAGQGQIMRVLGPMVGCPKMYLGAMFLINQLINLGACTESLMGFPGGASGNEPACQYRRHATWVPPLAWEDPLEEGRATHSSILAWRIPWTEEAGRL